MTEVTKFADLQSSEPAFPNAERVEKDVLKGKELLIKAVEERNGDQGTYAIVCADVDGKEVSFSIGGVVSEQLQKHKDKLPISATLTEKKSASGRMYFTLE